MALLAASAGCSKSNEQPKAAPGSATGSAGSGSGSGSAKVAPKVGDIAVTVGSKPIVVDQAFVKRLPDGRLQLYLGSGSSCAELMSNMFGGSSHVLVDLQSLLLADGGETTGIGDIYAGPPTKPGTGDWHDVKVRGELTKDKPVAIDLRVSVKETGLEMKGTANADFCGDQDAPPPPAQPPELATMTIAGKSFPIRTALKRGDDVELVDQPRDCTSAHYIGVRLRRERGTWLLDGTRIPVELSGTAPALKVTAAPKQDKAAPLTMTLAGEDMVAAYKVALAGTVQVTDCAAK